MNRNVISLFSSSGIGDLGIEANGLATVINCELLKDRMELFHHNFPKTYNFLGDIWKLKEDIVAYYKSNFKEPPFILLATPPCQGMSSNGMGKMLCDYRKGIRPKFDERNRLIIPTIEIIKNLQPYWVILENVPNMENTCIEEGNAIIKIMDYIKKELSDTYLIQPKVIDVADYGVPQHRRRLFTILTKTPQGKKYFSSNHTLFPSPTHSKYNTLTTKRWVTLKDAIGNLPSLHAVNGQNIDKNNPLHKVPLLDDKKMFWIKYTPEGKSAFDNQCINPSCMYQGNKCHGAMKNEKGINKSLTETPLYCEKCGSLLPRPYTENKEKTEKKLMKGFVSAYKRMLWNEPASTLTQNFQYACSDNKIHPSQDRVLSLYEGMIIQTISNYNYSFEINGKLVSDSLIRDTIGESVPPQIIDLICKQILTIMNIYV